MFSMDKAVADRNLLSVIAAIVAFRGIKNALMACLT